MEARVNHFHFHYVCPAVFFPVFNAKMFRKKPAEGGKNIKKLRVLKPSYCKFRTWCFSFSFFLSQLGSENPKSSFVFGHFRRRRVKQAAAAAAAFPFNEYCLVPRRSFLVQFSPFQKGTNFFLLFPGRKNSFQNGRSPLELLKKP